MRRSAHIALIPNQLSPVHRDLKICMSLKLKGLPTPYKFKSGSDAITRPELKAHAWVWVRP